MINTYVIIDGEKINTNHPDIEYVSIDVDIHGESIMTFKYRDNILKSIVYVHRLSDPLGNSIFREDPWA